MRKLEELIDTNAPGWPIVQEWIARAVHPVEVLPPSPARGQVLVDVQVTPRSPMGAIAYETGGILIDHGWIRILGSGHPRLTRTLPGWNAGRSNGFYLVADDAVGGFFAINGGALGPDARSMYYFAPDSLRWEPMKMGYSSFVEWACSGDIDGFYEWIRWKSWKQDAAALPGDRTFFFWPPLFTKEGKGGQGSRKDVPAHESWGMQMDFVSQLGS